MGTIDDLRKHYDDKWGEFPSKMPAIPTIKGKWRYGVQMTHKDFKNIQLLIEYDQNKPSYGIYFGCKTPVNNEKINELQEMKKDIWESYKAEYYKDVDVDVDIDNVFLPDCELDCTETENMFWLFWIRLDEHLEMNDALLRLNKLVEIFKGKGFDQ